MYVLYLFYPADVTIPEIAADKCDALTFCNSLVYSDADFNYTKCATFSKKVLNIFPSVIVRKKKKQSPLCTIFPP
jgi:hypothetical protein